MALKKIHGDATAPSESQVCTIDRMDCAQIERPPILDGTFALTLSKNPTDSEIMELEGRNALITEI